MNQRFFYTTFGVIAGLVFVFFKKPFCDGEAKFLSTHHLSPELTVIAAVIFPLILFCILMVLSLLAGRIFFRKKGKS